MEMIHFLYLSIKRLSTVIGSIPLPPAHFAFKASFKGFPCIRNIYSMSQPAIFKIFFVHLDLCHNDIEYS